MERLTEKAKSGMVWFMDPENNHLILEPCEMTAHHNRLALVELARYEDTGLTPEQIAELSQTAGRWANEARIQAAAAGELKIALAEKLEETRQRKEVVGGLITETRSDMDRVVLDWKLMQFEEQEKWLVEMLEKDRQAAGQEET